MQQSYVAPNPIQNTPIFSYPATPAIQLQNHPSLVQVPYTTTQVHQQPQHLTSTIGSTSTVQVFPTTSNNQQQFL